MTIAVRLLGGLGNQMFQYAMGRSLSLRFNTDLVLDLKELHDRTPRDDFVFREFDLPIFNIQARVGTEEELRGMRPAEKGPLDRAFLTLTSRLGLSRVVSERGFRYDPHTRKCRDRAYVIGFWQSYRYFEDIEWQIRQDFSHKIPLSSQAQDVASQIESGNAVCLNVRRADYVNIAKTLRHHGFCGAEYFYPAVEVMKDRVGQCELFVFSDDIAWCRDNLSFSSPTHFVSHACAGEKFSNYLDLMSRCKHFIIPNSTFGWWAAWMSSHPGKHVIAPKRWFRTDIDTSDLIPTSWVRM